MAYKLPARSGIEFIALKIRNINQMVDFYTKVVGLYLIRRTEDQAYLGIPSRKRVFISLRRIHRPAKDKHVANLKSFTLLLPDRDSLKKILVHINNLGIRVSRIRSSSYFDLFYLRDPEGNRVELGIEKFDPNVTDLQRVHWLDRPVKKISVHRYLHGAKTKSDRLPSSTRFGWIEMTVADWKASVNFYHRQLGMAVQSDTVTGQLVLMGARDHRQQLILDPVSSLRPRHTNTLGLDYFNVKLFTTDEIIRLARHLNTEKVPHQYSAANHFIFVEDPDDVNMTFSLL